MAATTSGTCTDPIRLNEYAYDAAGQLTAIAYNGEPDEVNTWTLDGAQTSNECWDGAMTHFDTDLAGELVAVTERWDPEDDSTRRTIEYTHDAQGKRTSMSVDERVYLAWA